MDTIFTICVIIILYIIFLGLFFLLGAAESMVHSVVRKEKIGKTEVIIVIVWLLLAAIWFLSSPVVRNALRTDKNAPVADEAEQVTDDKHYTVQTAIPTPRPTTTPRPTATSSPMPQVYFEADCSGSSAIYSASYNSGTEIMTVVFRSNTSIKYFLYDFPLTEWNNFSTAESMGRYYQYNIRGRYEGDKVDLEKLGEGYDDGFKDGYEDGKTNTYRTFSYKNNDKDYIEGYDDGYRDGFQESFLEYNPEYDESDLP